MVLSDTAIRRPVTTVMVMLGLVTFGIIGYQRMGVDLFPNIDFPIVTVTTIYRGADPTTMEEKVSRKLEDAINQVSGIKNLRSVSLENVSQVIIIFELGKDIDIATQEVRDRVSSALRTLPPDIEAPQVEKADVGASPVLTLAITGEAGTDTAVLGEFADGRVKEALRKIEGVGGIDLIGYRDRTIWVYVDPQALKRHNVTMQDVVSSLGYQNLDIPAGSVPQPGREIGVKTRGAATSLDELGGVMVMNYQGAVVRLRDVARLVDGLEEERSRSDLGGRPAVSLVVRKQSGTNTVAMAKRIKEALPGILALAPPGVRIDVVNDMSVFIEESVQDALFDLVFGAFLAVVIIALFLRNLRMTLIAAVAIPTSVIGAFAFMKAFGFTLNYLTLLGLSLSVGLLVDDAIVVLENIFRHVEHGEARRSAASTATAEIGLAVTATTFSLVAVFGPIATTGGIVGRLLRDFGLTVTAAVLISLFVSFTLTPMLSARFVTLPTANRVTAAIEAALAAVESAYLAIVRRALRHRALVVLGAVGVFATSLWMMTFLDKEMVPGMDRSQFQIFIETPPGSSLERTQEVVNEVAASLKGVEGVKFLVSTLGGGIQGKVENATLYVELVDRRERSYSQFDLMNELRRRFTGYKKATVSVEEVQMFSIGGMRAAILQFNVRGPSQIEAARLAARITERMRQAGGYTDIDTTYRTGKPEFGFRPDRERAYSLGVPVALIGQTLRFAVAGDKVSDYKEAGEQYAIRVRLDEKARGDLDTLKGLEVRSPSGRTVEIGNVAVVEPGQGPLSIERQAGQRQVTIMANLSGKALGPAIEEMRAFAAEEVKLPGYSTDFAGQAEFMDENFREITKALILAIILIYFILAAQFESFIHPFTIMLSLPLSVVGGVGALLLMRDTLSILGMIGFVMLMGLVTKNAILLVDFAIQGRGRGLSANDAVTEAGRTRLRPILMTTAAMVFGMLPIAMALSKGSEARAPMAVVVIGGVLASTVLTLVVVPVVYSLFEGMLHRIGASASSRE